MLKVLSVFGTRPEAIKMAPVVKHLASEPLIESIVCITAQHRVMLDSVLSLFSIRPDYDLDLMRPDQSLADLTAEAVRQVGGVIASVKPDIVLVHGDTTTTMAASLAAYYHQCAVGHVEAGLRTHNIYAPWPEEINRRVAGVIARHHFAPTRAAAQNLRDENIDPAAIHITGNTVIDALLDVAHGIDSDAAFQDCMLAEYPFLSSVHSGERRLILVTAHRRESFGEGFRNICEALLEIAVREDVLIVYPVHLNPNVREPVFRMLGESDNIKLLNPLDYRPFVAFMKHAYLILTDSGGVQEEAPSLGKPVLVMREETERGEAVATGVVRLVGQNRGRIVGETASLLDDSTLYRVMSRGVNPYGDGRAAGRIVDILLGRPAEWKNAI